MFVRMEFVKQPEAGQGGGEEDEEMEGRAAQGARQGGKGARGGFGQGRGGKQVGKKMKFIEDELKEDQIMKPCVYKLR
ncbi:hypothetical protein K440DRAFT_614909 [Wilcoxina mikolae CBS 423.85]|nr:hypothetical protein K440DRAFT_614909 [Wilcoxina mikolae CBS 423.85]